MADDFLEDEFKPHYQTWKAAPTPANNDLMLKAVDPIVQSALKTYVGGEPSKTIRSKAKRIVLDALPRYDPGRAKLRTHLMVNLQSLRRASAQEGQVIPIPERVGLEQYHAHVAEEELRDQLARDPSTQELAQKTGMSIRRLKYIRSVKPPLAEGQMLSAFDDDDKASSADAPVISNDQDPWLMFIYHDLHPTDQVIMEHVLGMHGKKVLPKGKIAIKLGLSSGAVSQRAARIQQLIDSRSELAPSLFAG
jgi:DNA-directed RNA polymerase specialized sigma subunit